MKSWNTFFSVAGGCIIVFMILPAPLGLTSLTQWGGMYTDGWCNAYLESKLTRPDAEPLTEDQASERVQSPTSRIVFSAPMHNSKMCTAWAQSWCGVSRYPNSRVVSARPFYRGEYTHGETNICLIPRFDPPWYIQD